MSGSPLELGPAIRRQLTRLRRRARASLVLRGLARLVLASLGLAALSFALDRPLRLAWETRAALLAIAVTLELALVWRWLVRPLTTPLPDDELARMVERVHPQLEWRLVSAVQFADAAWRPSADTSLPLAAQVIADAEALAAAPALSFGRAVPGRPVARTAGWALLALGVAAAAGWSWPHTARTWLLRNVLLSVSERWPQDTHLQLLLEAPDGRIAVPHGGDLALLVEATGVIPRRVVLDSDLPGGAGSMAFDVLGGRSSAGAQRFRTVLDRITEPFQLSIHGGDAALGPYRVEVVHRPWVESLRLAVEPPAYTGLEARSFELESTDVALPVGTQVRALARISAPLQRGWLEVEAADPAVVHTGVVSDGGRALAVELTLQETERLRLRVQDGNGFGLDAPVRFTLRAQADRAPQVSLALRGVGPNVTRRARLRYQVAASDDYGLGGGALHLQAAGGEAPSDDAGEGGEDPAAAPQPREETLPLEALAAGAQGRAQGVLELSALDLPLRAAVTVWAEAQDGRPGAPQVGSSPSVQLRIVPEEELLNDLLRRLQEVRQQLERLADEEDRLAAALRSEAPTEAIGRAAAVQRDVGRAAVRSGDTVQGVVEELITNQLLDPPAWERLRTQVAEPLRQLPEARGAEALARAEAAAADAGRAVGAAAAAAEVARELRAIAARIGRLEDLAALVAELKRIIREQHDLMERTRRARGRD